MLGAEYRPALTEDARRKRFDLLAGAEEGIQLLAQFVDQLVPRVFKWNADHVRSPAGMLFTLLAGQFLRVIHRLFVAEAEAPELAGSQLHDVVSLFTFERDLVASPLQGRFLADH